MAANKTPAWVWIGCGCMLMVGLLVAGIGGLSYFGFSMFKTMIEDMADPLARAEATMDLLGAETLPEGWNSHAFFKIPFVMDIAILTDSTEPPEAIEGSFEEKAEAMENLVLRHDQLGRNMFLYMKLRGRDNQPFEDLLAGRSTNGTHVNLDVTLEPTEDLATGELQVGAQELTWQARKGTMETLGGSAEGVYAIVKIVCGTGDSHDALWFQRLEAESPQATGPESISDEATAVEAEGSLEQDQDSLQVEDSANESEASLEGTPADPIAIKWLFEHFNFC